MTSKASIRTEACARIEVKATTGLEPTDPFVISDSELRFAIAHHDQYFIYRVTDVKSSSPRVHRYRDPIALLGRSPASLHLSRARMALPEPGEA